jgi:cell division septal protein FtsQ
MSKMRENQKKRRVAGKVANANMRNGHQLDVRVPSRKASSLRWRIKFHKFFKITALIAFCFAVVVGVYRGIDYFLFENPSFQVNEISYSSDGSLGKDRVLDCLGLRTGENILRLDLEAMRQKILSEIPRAREVNIIRDLPDRLSFEIQERFAVAWLGNTARLQSPQRCRGGLLVGSDGMVMRCEMLEPGYEDFPVIFPEEKITILPGNMIESVALTKGLEIVLSCASFLKKSPVNLQSLRVTSAYSLVGYLNTGTEVIFGLEDINRQVSNLKVLLDEGTRRGEALATVNLLPKKNIPVRFTELGVPAGAGAEVVPVAPESVLSGRQGAPRRVQRRIPRRAVTQGIRNSGG